MKKFVVLMILVCLSMIAQAALADPTCPVLNYTGASQALVSDEAGEGGFFSTDGGNTYANAIPSAKNSGTTWEIWWYLADEAEAKKICDQTINPIELTVTVTGSDSKLVYDGTEQILADYTVSYVDEQGEFADSDVVFAEGCEPRTAVNAGVYEMGLTAESFTSANKNYNVTFEVTDGTMEILPKDLGDEDIRLVITPNDIEYDGREHSVSVKVLFNGEELKEFTGEEVSEEAAPEAAEEPVEEPAAEAEETEEAVEELPAAEEAAEAVEESTEEAVEGEEADVEKGIEPAADYVIDELSVLTATKAGIYAVSVSAVENGNFTGSAVSGWRIAERSPYDLFRFGN